MVDSPPIVNLQLVTLKPMFTEQAGASELAIGAGKVSSQNPQERGQFL
jgi:hypothetical protein